MNNLTQYDDFLSEGLLSTVSAFLKAQYNNIFKDPNKALNNLFNDFTKRLDKEKNVSNLYQRFIRSNQTTVQNEINNASSIDEVNKVLTDNIKYFYFSLNPVINKLQDSDFNMKNIFEKSRDKRLQTLMSYPEDQFSNAVQQYVNDGVLPWIKKDSGLDKQENRQQTQEPQSQFEKESIMYNIAKILEADDPNQQQQANQQQANQEDDLVKYKKSAIKWINITLFDLLKLKFTDINQGNTGNIVVQLSKQMKGTMNDNAKKTILNNIINMNKEQLQGLANYLQIKDIGKL
jgi:hypothetical protein